MNVIGQDADRDSFKRTALLDCTVNLPQAVDLIHKKIARPFGENHRENEHAAFEFGSNVPRHDELYHEPLWWARREERLCPPSYGAL
jgi:hypothetical protein